MSNKIFKAIKIPVDYFTGEMQSYPSNYKIYVDTKTNKRFTGRMGRPYKSECDTDEEYNEENRKYLDFLLKYKNGEYIRVDSIKYIDNHIFESTMKIIGTERGRSSARFILESSDGLKYSMFMKSTLHLIENAVINKGVVSGKWCYVKRGSNYGIEYVGGLDA